MNCYSMIGSCFNYRTIHAHDVQVEAIVYTGKNDLTRRVTHREAVFEMVIHSIFDAWHYECPMDLNVD